MLMYIAAIEKISPDYYEAATIEGANVFDKFFHITLPLIKGVLGTSLVLWTTKTMGFRRSGKPVVLVVNKVDSIQKFMMDVYEFYNLGIGEPIPISAANRMGLGDMLDEVAEKEEIGRAHV